MITKFFFALVLFFNTHFGPVTFQDDPTKLPPKQEEPGKIVIYEDIAP